LLKMICSILKEIQEPTAVSLPADSIIEQLTFINCLNLIVEFICCLCAKKSCKSEHGKGCKKIRAYFNYLADVYVSSALRGLIRQMKTIFDLKTQNSTEFDILFRIEW